jgi:hypothetical protein
MCEIYGMITHTTSFWPAPTLAPSEYSYNSLEHPKENTAAEIPRLRAHLCLLTALEYFAQSVPESPYQKAQDTA